MLHWNFGEKDDKGDAMQRLVTWACNILCTSAELHQKHKEWERGERRCFESISDPEVQRLMYNYWGSAQLFKNEELKSEWQEWRNFTISEHERNEEIWRYRSMRGMKKFDDIGVLVLESHRTWQQCTIRSTQNQFWKLSSNSGWTTDTMTYMPRQTRQPANTPEDPVPLFCAESLWLHFVHSIQPCLSPVAAWILSWNSWSFVVFYNQKLVVYIRCFCRLLARPSIDLGNFATPAV